MVEGQVLFFDTVFGIGFLFWVTEKSGVVFLVSILVNNGVKGILDGIVIGEIVKLVFVVIKFEDWLNVVNDTELLEVDICACVVGVGVWVCVIAVIWTDGFDGFDVIVLEKCGLWCCRCPTMRWTCVVIGKIVFETVGLFKAELLRVGKCANLYGIGVVLPINVGVRTDGGDDRDISGLTEVNL